MPRFAIASTLKNKEGFLCALWALLQQAVVAASTYFIIEAISAMTKQNLDRSVIYIAAFVASLILVYIPNTISLIYLQAWRLRSFGLFVEAFISANQGRTTWAHHRDKTKFESWLTNESTTIFDNSTNLLYQVYSTLLSSIFNIAVIAVFIDRRIMFWYLAAGVLLLVSNRFFRAPIAHASLGVQQSRTALSNVMLSAWENILTGNRHNLSNWRHRFDASLSESRKTAIGYDVTRSVISSLTVSAALLIIGAGNAIFFAENRANLPALAALLITLPRQLQVIQNIFAFFNIYLSWEGVGRQLQELASIVDLSRETKDLSKFIQLERLALSVDGHELKITGLEELRQHLLQNDRGRYTLRGQNGAGKSTLLSWLAESTGEASFFLPTNCVDLAFVNADVFKHSDGNRMLSVFEELRGLTEVKYILLDEWDANLDAENIRRIDEGIAELSKSRVVIESRHRG